MDKLNTLIVHLTEENDLIVALSNSNTFKYEVKNNKDIGKKILKLLQEEHASLEKSFADL